LGGIPEGLGRLFDVSRLIFFLHGRVICVD